MSSVHPSVDGRTPRPICITHSMRIRTTTRCLRYTHRISGKLRPLMGRLRPLLHMWWSRWYRSLHVFPLIHSIRASPRRRTASVVATVIVMAAVLACHRLLHPPKRPCSLWCPYLAGSADPRWHPRLVPIDHACVSKTDLPIPCVSNTSYSALLEQPPFSFLKNFRNPCWYEPLTLTDPDSTDPYTLNLFSCFSRGSQRHFTYMAEVFRDNYHQKADTTQVWEQPEDSRQRLRCLPYFYIAGMPKSGSTDLFRKLMLHPDIVRPPMKEPHWWSKNRFGQRLNFTSSIPLEDYIDLFDRAAREIEHSPQQTAPDVLTSDDLLLDSGDSDFSTTDDTHTKFYHPAVTMDASASTFWNNDEWWRLSENCGHTEPLFTNAHYIQRLTPQAKVIVILRNPIDRLFSDYLYFTKTNKSLTAFHENVLLSIDKLNNCTDQRSLRACIYDKRTLVGKGKVRLRIGVYHVYLSEWLSVFPPSQLLVLRTEEYSRKLRRTIRHVYQFLGLRPLNRQEEKRVLQLPKANTRRLEDQKLGSMLQETRQALQDFYHPHNQQLARLLGDKQFLWQQEEEETPTSAFSLQQKSPVPRKHGEIARRSTAYHDDDPASQDNPSHETRTPKKTIIARSKTTVNKNRDDYVDLYVDIKETSLYNQTWSFLGPHMDTDLRTMQYYHEQSVDNEVEGTTEVDGNQIGVMTEDEEDMDVDDESYKSPLVTDAVWPEGAENFETVDDDDYYDYDEEDTDYRSYSDV